MRPRFARVRNSTQSASSPRASASGDPRRGPQGKPVRPRSRATKTSRDPAYFTLVLPRLLLRPVSMYAYMYRARARGMSVFRVRDSARTFLPLTKGAPVGVDLARPLFASVAIISATAPAPSSASEFFPLRGERLREFAGISFVSAPARGSYIARRGPAFSGRRVGAADSRRDFFAHSAAL